MNVVTSSSDDLPQDLAVIKTYNRVRDAFPEEGVAVDVAVEADDVRSGESAAGISLLQRRAENSDNVLPGTRGQLQQGRHRRRGRRSRRSATETTTSRPRR